ncbi:MAG: DUF7594 domain-containing protein, partial [Gaiellaceae bacterium]
MTGQTPTGGEEEPDDSGTIATADEDGQTSSTEAPTPTKPPGAAPQSTEQAGSQPRPAAIVWLYTALPDPIPPAQRLTPAFARQLRAAAREAGVDWQLILAVLRARGHDGSTPARPGPLRRLARQLSSLGAVSHPMSALLALTSRNESFAKRALVLEDYYDAVGLRALVTGLKAARSELAARVLDDERIDIYPAGRLDVASGRIDVRILVLVRYLAEVHGQVTVSSLRTGHRLYARPGVVSAHVYGLAVDISALGGLPIAGNQDPGGLTERAVRNILLLPSELRPEQVIALFGLGGPSFPLADHYDHIHVGYGLSPSSQEPSVGEGTSARRPPRAPTQSPADVVAGETGGLLRGETASAQIVKASADAYVSSAAPTRNFGSETTLLGAGSPHGGESHLVRSYLRFDLGELSGPVASARLRVYAITGDKKLGFEVSEVADSSWEERTITYASSPAQSSTVAGSSGPFDAGEWVEVDVSSLVTGSGSLSLALTSSSLSPVALASREFGAAAGPELIVRTTQAPTTSLSPTPSGTAQAADPGFVAAAPIPPTVATLHVSPSGWDGNPCTQVAPCRSFHRAYSRAAPGDRIEAAGGTYPGSESVNGAKSSTMPVVIEAASGASVTVTGSFHVAADYVTVRSIRAVDGWRVVGSDSSDPIVGVRLENVSGRNVFIQNASDPVVTGGDLGPSAGGEIECMEANNVQAPGDQPRPQPACASHDRGIDPSTAPAHDPGEGPVRGSRLTIPLQQGTSEELAMRLRPISGLAAALMAGGLTVPSTASASSTGTLHRFAPVADAFVTKAHPRTNYGGARDLRLDHSPVERSYLRFNVQGLDGPVGRALLYVFARTGSTRGYTAWTISGRPWRESTLTFANAPTLSSAMDTSGGFQSGRWTSVGVTAAVEGDGLVSLALATPSTSKIRLASRQSVLSPRLVIQTDAGPPTVTITSPHAGHVYTQPQTETVAAAASDDVVVRKVEFYDNGSLVKRDSRRPYSYSWAVEESANGEHNWTAKAYDGAKQSSISAPVNVTVDIRGSTPPSDSTPPS